MTQPGVIPMMTEGMTGAEWWQAQYNALLRFVESRRNNQMFTFSREFAMPDEATFSIRPISDLLDRWLIPGSTLICDPFARDSTRGTMTNDLNPRTRAQSHLPAEEFLANFEKEGFAHAVLFDPPYSPRQIAECYKLSGKKAAMMDTQNARLCKVVKDGLHRILAPGGIAICCGWNSGGMGVGRGYEMQEILLVHHGSAHNDTIVTVERKIVANQGEVSCLNK